jgi:hypothetical protein
MSQRATRQAKKEDSTVDQSQEDQNYSNNKVLNPTMKK